MSKRGQATIIIFLSLVILVIIILLFYVKGQIYIGGSSVEDLRRELDPVIRHVEKCLYDTTTESAILIGQQGGYLDPQETTYRLYQDYKISYLCYNRKDLPSCSNRYLRLKDIQNYLIQSITPKLDSCLQIESFKKRGYELITGEKNLKVDIGSDNIITTLEHSVTIKKDSSEVKIDIFSKAVPLPLGRLFSASQDIINIESLSGVFEPLVYSIVESKLTGKPYIIQRLKPHPDKLYILKIKDTPTEKEPYIFQFFIEGEETR